jgi:diacylglycerol kinase (ATP)
MSEKKERKVLAIANPRSGLHWSFDAVRTAMDRFWDVPGTFLSYQFCQGIDDALRKVRRAVEADVDVVLVMGGDGTVNSIGRALIGTRAALGIVPVGSGNGFARHFEIPLSPAKAVESLARGKVKSIDVGEVAGAPFLVTSSMAWDAAIARGFARSPIRGVFPYIFAGVTEYLEYEPQDLTVQIDGGEEIRFESPIVFTVANLSEYGGGAKIAPRAREDDGKLELVVAMSQDVPRLLANIGRLFDGSLDGAPGVITRSFESLVVRRERAVPIQVDGELMEAETEIHVRVLPEKLRVLIPS